MVRTTGFQVLGYLLVGVLTLARAQADPISLEVKAGSAGKAISPDLFGIFFEDLNHGADGGLYAELVQNRSFEFAATENPAWNNLSFWSVTPFGNANASLEVEQAAPVHANNPHYAVFEIRQPAGEGAALTNAGFGGIPVRAGETYDFSIFARQLYFGKRWGEPQAGKSPLVVRLEAPDGTVLAEHSMEVANREWQKFEATLVPRRTEPAAKLALLAKSGGGIALDEVSLFPRKTFRERRNGLRADLAQVIAELKPRFLRFPGGCLVHGNGLGNMYRWQETVGPVEQRRQQPNLWGYHQSVGLGYFEYFQFAEDIGAKPLPVVPAGVCCQNSDHQGGTGQRALPEDAMPAYIQEVLDLIEFANGSVTSRWGAVRAAAGHPAPFNLEYLGIGNEDRITFLFTKRFEMVYRAVKERHPGITVVGTVGPFHSGEDFDRGWKLANELSLPMVDEHYYVSPQWFWDNLARYDTYDRARSKVYLGEYAAHESNRRSTVRAALAEAAHLTSLERNGDVVRMASYAPLVAREGLTDWNPNLIYFDATRVFPTVGYEVQRLFGNNAGDIYVESSLTGVRAGQRIAVSSVQQGASGDLILKIVNGDDSEQTVNIGLGKFATSPGTAALTVLSGAADEFNDYSKGRLVKPKSSTIAVASSFAYVAPANSLSVIRVRRGR